MRDYVFPMFRANALYEGQYLLGTSIARPLIAKAQIEIARKVGADAVCHGATGKGNDQVRFELGYYALEPDIRVIAPWREWDFASREALLDFAEQHQIPIAKDKRDEAPFSVDANLLHSSSEGKVLEDPAVEPPEFVYQRTISPEAAPDKATVIDIEFERGDPVAIDGERLTPAGLLTKLNAARPRQRHRPARPGGEPLRRHEVARRLRDAGRNHPARRPPGHRIHHAGSRRRAPEGRADAPLCGADLQRLLVRPGARDAAGPDRQVPGAGHRPRAGEALQGQRHGDRPREPQLPLRPGAGHLRGGQGRLRPPRRGRLHQAERPSPARGRPARRRARSIRSRPVALGA